MSIMDDTNFRFYERVDGGFLDGDRVRSADEIIKDLVGDRKIYYQTYQSCKWKETEKHEVEAWYLERPPTKADYQFFFAQAFDDERLVVSIDHLKRCGVDVDV